MASERQPLTWLPVSGQVLIFSAAVAIGVASTHWIGLMVLCLGGAVLANVVLATITLPAALRNRVVGASVLLLSGYLIVGLVLTQVITQADSRGYYRSALYLADRQGDRTTLTGAGAGREGYVLVLAWLFRIGQPDFLVLVAFSAATLSMSFVLMYRAVHQGFGPDTARFVIPVFALSPGFLVWGTQPLRESSVILILSAMCAVAVSASERITSVKLAVIIGLGAVLLVFRGSVAPLVTVAVIAAVLGSAKGLTRRPQYLGVASVAVLAGVAVYSAYGGAARLQASYFDLDRLEVARSALGGADSGFSRDGLSPVSLASGLVRVAFGPLPWEWPQFALAVPDAIFWSFLIPISAASVLALGLRKAYLYLLPAFTLILSIAVGVTNYGTSVRLRTMAFIWLVPLLCDFLARRSEKLRSRPERRRMVRAT